MYPAIALKRVVYEVPYLFHFERTVEKIGILWEAGHYVFNAVAEFVCPETVRLVAYESSLSHLCTEDMAVDWFLNRYDESRDNENNGWGARLRDHKATVSVDYLQSMKLFPVEHLPLLINWEKKYPRFDWLLKNGLGRADYKPRRMNVHKKETVPAPA
jgi:hypothetical protein